MQPEPDDQLAAALHRELRQLPPHRAPATLMTNVLAALVAGPAAAQAQPLRVAWWLRSWFEWPRAVRQLSGMAAGVAFATLGAVGMLVWNFDLVMGFGPAAGEAWSMIGALGNALALLGQAVPMVALLAIGSVLTASYLCAIAVGTLFFRYTLQNQSALHS